MEFNDNINATVKQTNIFSEDFDGFFGSTNNIVKYRPSLAVFLFTVNIVGILLAVLGNLTVILTIVAHRVLWVPTNILVASLAVVDFMVGTILQTCNAWNLLNTLLRGERHCSLRCMTFVRIIAFVTITASLSHLSLITLDRFAAIVYPLRYVTIITMSRIKKAVMFAWTTSFVFGSLAVIPSPLTNGTRALWFLFMLLSCVFMVCLHGKLYCISRKHAKQIRDEIHSVTPEAETKQERRGLTTAAIVTMALLVSFLPSIILGADENLASEKRGEIAKLVHDILQQLAVILIFFNSALNPLVYFFRSEKLRTYSLKLIKSIPTRVQESV